MRKNTLLLLGLAIVIIVLFVTAILSSKKTIPGTTKPTLEGQISNVTSQYQKGQITHEEANKQFCTLTTRPKEEQQKAVESIRKYANKLDLAVEYKCNNFSPNNPTAKPTEETYLTEGVYYFVDIATNQVSRTQTSP